MLRITFPFIRVNSLLKSLFSLCSIYLYVWACYVFLFLSFLSPFLSCLLFSKVFIFPSTGSSHLIRSNSKRIIGYDFLPFVVFSSSLCSTLLCKRIVLLGILLSHLLAFCRCSSPSSSAARFSFVVRHFSLSHFFTSSAFASASLICFHYLLLFECELIDHRCGADITQQYVYTLTQHSAIH